MTRYSNEIKFLIAQGEGYNIEFKEFFSKKIAVDICAFANANGGWVKGDGKRD